MDSLEIKKIGSEYTKELSRMLSNSSHEYSKHFIPFSFDVESVLEAFSKVKNDYFFGIFFSEQLIGFYMLRGFDEGYEVPSYGVFIDENYAGKGLGKLTLVHAISLTKLLNKKKLMLKVHPENEVAKKLYLNYGFIENGIDPKNSNLIMFKDIK